MMPAPAAGREFKELPLGLIDDPELPSRTEMNDEKMSELAASIRAIGLQQPIVVHRAGERFTVIAGHRRLIACKRAGLVVAPCIIYPTKEAGARKIQYAENRFREDISYTDEALLFAELLERDCNGDVDQLCELIGEKRAYVESRLLLLGDAEIFEALKSGRLPKIGIALELLKVTDPTMRRYYLDAAIRGGATVAIVNGWVQDWKQQQRDNGSAFVSTAAAAPAGVAPQMNYFTCAVCRGTDNVHLMQPINVHTHCRLAILDKLLAEFHGEQ